jgi:hypothetical protein
MKPAQLQYFAISLTLLLSAALTSCSRTDDPTPASTVGGDYALDYFESRGFNTATVQRVDSGYLVEGDMFFSDVHIERTKAKQYAFTPQQLVSFNNQDPIYLNPIGLNANWISGLDQAIIEWNNLFNCRIRFVRSSVNPNGIPISFPTPYEGDGCASADIPAPFSGLPGAFIRLNSFYLNSLTVDKIKLLFMHELGHIVGYNHSNNVGSGAYFFQGTATKDDLSIMDWDNCNFTYTQRPLTYFDRLTAALVYPESWPLPNTAPLYRYRNENSTNHLYTTNWSEFGGRINFSSGPPPYYEGITCYVGSVQFPGSVPLLRYRHSTLNTQFYSVSVLGAPYVYQGFEGFVFLSQSTGTIPLLRYRQNGTSHYIYTVSAFSIAGWSFDGIACYVYPPPTL